MAVRILKTIQLGQTQLVTGRFYLFDYSRFITDPKPLIIFMNVHRGVHENTGHQHFFLQGLNMHYLPINKRLSVFKRGIDINKDEKFALKNFQKFYEKIQQVIPNIDFAVRRYLITPPGLIRNIRRLDNDFMLEYFTNPVSVIQKKWEVVDKVYLAGKMRAMRTYLKPISKSRKKK